MCEWCWDMDSRWDGGEIFLAPHLMQFVATPYSPRSSVGRAGIGAPAGNGLKGFAPHPTLLSVTPESPRSSADYPWIGTVGKAVKEFQPPGHAVGSYTLDAMVRCTPCGNETLGGKEVKDCQLPMPRCWRLPPSPPVPLRAVRG